MEVGQQSDTTQIAENVENKEGAVGAKLLLEGEQNNETESDEVKRIEQTENFEGTQDNKVNEGEENEKTENIETIENKEEEQKEKMDSAEKIIVGGEEQSKTDNIEDKGENHTYRAENTTVLEDEEKSKTEIVESNEIKEEEKKDKVEITENNEISESDQKITTNDVENNEVSGDQKEITEVKENPEANEEEQKSNTEIIENTEITENIKATEEAENGIKSDIEVTEGELIDKSGRKLYTKQWKGSEPVQGCVFLCHGYAERCTPYYDGVAEECVKRGLLAFSHDHVGHGKSEGSRVQVDSMDWYVQPVIEHINKVKEQYKELPFFVVGHSMGGLITMLTAIEQEELVRGLVLMGPLVEPDRKMATPTKVWLAKTCSKIVPNFSMSGINTKDVTSDEEWIKKKKEDPDHYHGGFKARHSYVLIKALANLDFAKLKTPLLILHGAEDRICAPAGSKKLLENAAAEDKTMELVENGLHNLFLEAEPIKSMSLKLCFDWIEARLGKKEGEQTNKADDTTENLRIIDAKEDQKENTEITDNNKISEGEETVKTENVEIIEIKEEQKDKIEDKKDNTKIPK